MSVRSVVAFWLATPWTPPLWQHGFFLVNCFGVATLFDFGEKRCRKNLPLSVTTLSVHRVLIDATSCPQAVIDTHFSDSGVEYALYHGDAFQLFIADSCSLEFAIAATDAFFNEHAERLNRLNFDASRPDDLSPELVLEFTFFHSVPELGVLLPQRLLQNLDRTFMRLKFETTRF